MGLIVRSSHGTSTVRNFGTVGGYTEIVSLADLQQRSNHCHILECILTIGRDPATGQEVVPELIIRQSNDFSDRKVLMRPDIIIGTVERGPWMIGPHNWDVTDTLSGIGLYQADTDSGRTTSSTALGAATAVFSLV